MWFYKFEHDPKAKNVRIIWNTKATYAKNLIGFGGVAACFLNFVWLAAICLTLLAAMLGYYLYRHGDLIKVLRMNERDHKLEYTGSRYSFSDPLMVIVPVTGCDR